MNICDNASWWCPTVTYFYLSLIYHYWKHIIHVSIKKNNELCMFVWILHTFAISDKWPFYRAVIRFVWRNQYISYAFWVLNALQLCTCLALNLFWSERHWWVLCRRNRAFGVSNCNPSTFDNYYRYFCLNPTIKNLDLQPNFRILFLKT